MNILFLKYDDPRTVSGGYRYDYQIAAKLKEFGHTVDFYGPSPANFLNKIFANFSNRIKCRLKLKKYDIIIEDELTHPSFFLLNKIIKKTFRVPLVSLIHNLSLSTTTSSSFGQARTFIEKAYLKTIDGFITTSESTREKVHSLSVRKPSLTLYPGRDTYTPVISWQSLVRRLEHNPAPVILYAGNITPLKGLDSLIEALHCLQQREWRLHIAGDETVAPDFIRMIKKKIHTYALQSRVTFFGLLSRETLAEKYAESNILAVPSWYEGFGMVYLEGMSFGLPILAAERGGAKELICNNENGFLVHPTQPRKIASCLELLLNNPLLLIEMGMKSYQRHLEFPTWEKSARSFESFLAAL